MEGYGADFSFLLDGSNSDETALLKHKALMFFLSALSCVYVNILTHITLTLQDHIVAWIDIKPNLSLRLIAFICLWHLLLHQYVVGVINIIPKPWLGISRLGREH